MTASSRAVAASVVALAIAGAVLRAATIGGQSFDYDESFTVGIVHGSLGHVLHRIPITESTPPLYYVLAWLWTRVFGIGAAGIRSLSALCGVLLIPVAFWIARRLASPRAGLVAAMLVAVNPFLVWYSEEARSYALLALLSALSFWAFIEALEEPRPRRLAVWALACAAALLTHYFAAFLVAPEALWLILATRRRAALLASAGVAAVGGALIPLLVSQADNRSQWIEALPLWGRIKEVAKKWLTGEIAPTRNWELAIAVALAAAAAALAARSLSARERSRLTLPLLTGAAALLIPLILDLAGLHYLISKNVMPAMAVLVIAVAVVLGSERARLPGAAGATVLAVLFLAIAVDGLFDPTVQRPDYREAAAALGPPAPAQVIATPNLGDAPMALYRPGAAPMPASGWPTSAIVLAEPLPRADASGSRPTTPPPPTGFALAGRRDARTFTLICYAAPSVRTVTPAELQGLSAEVNLQVWPGATSSARAAGGPCLAAGAGVG